MQQKWQLLLKCYSCCGYKMIVDKQGGGSTYAAVGRSVSGSSGEFSPDSHDIGRQSPTTLHAFTDKPATSHSASSKPKAKSHGFFDTLDWQDPNEPVAAAPVGTDHKKPNRSQQMAAFEIASASLDEAFADFSAQRISANTDVADVSSKDGELEHVSDSSKAQSATVDLLGGSAWKDAEAPKDLFDVGPPEPTNFDLLVGPETLGNTNGNSSSGVDLLNNDQSFVADFGTHTESSNNPFDVQDAGADYENSALSDMAADLFGTFDPFTSATADEKPLSSSNKLPKAVGHTDDFLAYIASSSATGSGMDDGPDLMSGWNASNILSGVSVSMPRASSRPDFGSTPVGVHTEVPRASSSQNMCSKSFGMTNGSTRSTKAADPFANIG